MCSGLGYKSKELSSSLCPYTAEMVGIGAFGHLLEEEKEDESEVKKDVSQVKDIESEVKGIESEVKDIESAEVKEDESKEKDVESKVKEDESKEKDIESEVKEDESKDIEDESEEKDIESEVKEDESKDIEDESEEKDIESEVKEDESKDQIKVKLEDYAVAFISIGLLIVPLLVLVMSFIPYNHRKLIGLSLVGADILLMEQAENGTEDTKSPYLGVEPGCY
ncbi:hypothetical protein Tco_1158555, partial [Tanacetum coccineum]